MISPPSLSRRRSRRLSLVAAAAAAPLVASFVQAPAGAAPRRPEPPAVPDDPSATHKVTLVTGDVVTVTTMADGRQIADVDRPDSAVGGVRMQEIKGDLYVVPDEASALLGRGQAGPAAVQRHRPDRDGLRRREPGTVPLIATYTRADGPRRRRATGAPRQQAGPRAPPSAAPR